MIFTEPLDGFYTRTIRKCLELMYESSVYVMEIKPGAFYFVLVELDESLSTIAPIEQWHELIYSETFLKGLVGEAMNEETNLPFWKEARISMSEYQHPADYLFNILDEIGQF